MAVGNQETCRRTGCCLRLDRLPIADVQPCPSGGKASSSDLLDQSTASIPIPRKVQLSSTKHLSRFPSRCRILQQVRRFYLQYRCQRLHHVESCIAAPSFCPAEIGPSASGKMSQLLLRQPAFATQSLQVQTECITKIHRANLPNVH